MSLPEIGRAVNRHHTTVLNALRRLDAMDVA
jgi:chromosomal replication initiation ATPase DnaA